MVGFLLELGTDGEPVVVIEVVVDEGAGELEEAATVTLVHPARDV